MTIAMATATNVSVFGNSGHWPGSFGFSPRNCDAAPSKTEFRSTLAVLLLVAMADQVFLATTADAGAGTGNLTAAGIADAEVATAEAAAPEATGGASCGRLTARRTEKSNSRFASRVLAWIVVALLSISSGLTSHSEL